MYQVGGWLDLLRDRQRPRAAVVSRRIPLNVIILGLTSLFTDISSEMVVSILPLYLVGFLRLSPVQFGLVDGLYQGVSALVQLASGVMSDRWQRYKTVAGAGYALSAAARVGLLITTAWMGITGLLTIDRLGKGIRTAPRDALISLSVERQHLGVAFGVHRAFDAFGAMLGPIVAFLILRRLPGGFDVVFVASLAAAVIGLALFGLYVEDKRPAVEPVQSFRVASGRAVTLLREPQFRRLVLAALLLGVMTISDAFVYLALSEGGHVSAGAFPLMFVLTSAVYLLLAVPIGRIADRAGRFATFVAGYIALLPLYMILSLSSGLWPVVAAVALLGFFYASTDGVLMALGSGMVRDDLRTTGLAVLTTVVAVARLSASLIFGAGWDRLGLQPTLLLFSFGLAVAIGAVAALRPRSEPE